MSDYSIKVVQYTSDRKDRRDFVKLMNCFKNNYFDNNPPYLFDNDMFMHVLSTRKDITHGLISKHNENIGMFEFVIGTMGNLRLMSLSTIYLQPKHRHKGISIEFYERCHNMFEQEGLVFCMHIEESKFLGKEQKFIDMGFTSYYVINEFDGPSKYKEKTYVLFRKPYLKIMLPIHADIAHNS